MFDAEEFPRWFGEHENEVKALEPKLQFFRTDEPTFKGGIDMKWGCTVCRYSFTLAVAMPNTVEEFSTVGKRFINFYAEAIEHGKETCKPTDRGTSTDIEYGYYIASFTDKPEHSSNAERNRGEGE